MGKRKAVNARFDTNSAMVGYEAELWRMADALRGSMDAAEYKHVVLGLIFLKYISDAFEEHRKKLLAEPYADPEDPDEYRAVNIFWVPKEARWAHLKFQARQPTIGRLVDDAMTAIESDNPPFNVSKWGGERLRDDKRWKYGVPPAGNANFA
jgi:type I restriction enzyme M protein